MPPAILLLGFTAVVSLEAAATLLCRYVGAGAAQMLLVLLGVIMVAAAGAAAPLPRRLLTARGALALLAATAGAFLLADRWILAAARWLGERAGMEASGAALAGLGGATLGPLLAALLLCFRVTSQRRPRAHAAWLLLGAAVGAACSRYVVYDALGPTSTLRAAAALLAVAIAIVASLAPPVAPRERDDGEPGDLLRLAAAAALGLVIGLVLRFAEPMTAGAPTAPQDALGFILIATATGIALASWHRDGRADLPLLLASAAALASVGTLRDAWEHAAFAVPLPPQAAPIAFVACASLAAAMTIGSPPRASRLIGLLLTAAATAIFVRLSPADPYVAARAALLLGVGPGLAGAFLARRRVRYAGPLAAAVVLGSCWWVGRSLDDAETRVRLSGWDRDGGAALLVRDSTSFWIDTDDGVPLRHDPTDPRATRRLVLIALALRDAPRRVLVLGAGAHHTIDALLTLHPDEITWVTDRRGDRRVAEEHPQRVQLVSTSERSFLERETDDFDLIVMAPWTGSRREHGVTRTAELHRLMIDRLDDDGVALLLHPLVNRSEIELRQEVLVPLVSTFAELVLFVDHPRNPAPMLGAITTPGKMRFSPDRIAQRLAELSQMPPVGEIVTRSDLDVRGVLQCHLMGIDVLNLYIDRKSSHDERPWLAASTTTGDGPIDAGALRWLQLRRAAPGGDFLVGAGVDQEQAPVAYQLSGLVRHDFQAATHLHDAAMQALQRGELGEDPERPPGFDDDLEPMFRAAMRSPHLALCRKPIERAINDRIRRRRFREAIEIGNRMLEFDRAGIDLKLMNARLRSRAGLVVGAIQSYQQILTRRPDHLAARVELAMILAARGSRVRHQAVPHLEFALASGRLSAAMTSRVELVHAFCTHQPNRARELIVELPPEEDDALLRFIRETYLE